MGIVLANEVVDEVVEKLAEGSRRAFRGGHSPLPEESIAQSAPPSREAAKGPASAASRRSPGPDRQASRQSPIIRTSVPEYISSIVATILAPRSLAYSC